MSCDPTESSGPDETPLEAAAPAESPVDRRQRARAGLELAARNAGVGVYWRDLHSDYGECNSTVLELFGLPDQPTLPPPVRFLEQVHPADRKRYAENWRRSRAEGERTDSEIRVVRPDGTVCWLLIRAQRVPAVGALPDRVAGVVLDVSARRSAEEAARRAQQRSELAAAAAGLGVWEWEPATERTWWSETMFTLFGHSREWFRNHTWIDAVHPEDRSGAADALMLAVDRQGPNEYEFRVVHADGTQRWLGARARLVQEADGERRLIGVTLDVTGQRAAREALIARDQALQANRAKSEFLARFSHELRTPLQAIVGFSQLLRLEQPGAISPEMARNTERIERASRHLVQLLNDVLDLSRIEAGHFDIAVTAVPVSELVRASTQMVELIAAESAVRIEVETQADLRVRADPLRAQQVLVNLLSNAVKHSPPGGTVTVRAGSTDDDMVQIAVIDQGPGVSPTQLAVVFEPFQRSARERSVAEGSGLGLAVARTLTQAMGGRLSVAGRLERGAEFHFELPQAGDEPLAAELLQEDEDDESITREDVRGVVLLVDANPADATQLRRALADRPNVTLFTARDGTSAAVMLQVCQPDLILLRGSNWPGPLTHGSTLVRLIRAGSDHRNAAADAALAESWHLPLARSELLRKIDAALRDRD